MIASHGPAHPYGAHVEPAAPAQPTTTSRTCWRGPSGLASLISERPLASHQPRLLAISLSLTGWSAACQLRLDASRLLTESTASCRSDMPWMGMPRQPCPGRVCTALHACIVRRALHGSAPAVRPWRGLHHQSCPAWVVASRHALNGYAGYACPGWYASSVMPGMDVRRQTCPGWVRRADMPGRVRHYQSCPAWVCTAGHALDGLAGPTGPGWVSHALWG